MIKKRLFLQLFAEGGEGAGEGGETSTQLATGEGQATEGTNTGEGSEGVDKSKAWKNLIKGDYKEEYSKSVQAIIDTRFKQMREMEERMNNQQNVLDFLAGRYGISDTSDIDAMLNALNEDDSMFEQKAAEMGLSVEQYRNIYRIEQENEKLRRAQQEAERVRNAEQTYNKWVNEGEALKKLYPTFDFETECANQDFLQLLQNGIDVRTAYEVVHNDEIIKGAMQMAASKTAERVTDSIRAKGMRPDENGVQRSSKAAGQKIDISKLTMQQINDLEKRAARGERIVF